MVIVTSSGGHCLKVQSGGSGSGQPRVSEDQSTPPGRPGPAQTEGLIAK